jgi:hypothetical protein
VPLLLVEMMEFFRCYFTVLNTTVYALVLIFLAVAIWIAGRGCLRPGEYQCDADKMDQEDTVFHGQPPLVAV